MPSVAGSLNLSYVTCTFGNQKNIALNDRFDADQRRRRPPPASSSSTKPAENRKVFVANDTLTNGEAPHHRVHRHDTVAHELFSACHYLTQCGLADKHRILACCARESRGCFDKGQAAVRSTRVRLSNKLKHNNQQNKTKKKDGKVSKGVTAACSAC